MNSLFDSLRRLCETNGRNWRFDGKRLVIPVGEGGRRQEIRFKREQDDYVLTSIVLSAARVTKTDPDWRELARLAWHRNAEHEVVTFAFDNRDRLVGQIRHPAEHLDAEELDLYVTALARETDRFEYLLSGSDEF